MQIHIRFLAAMIALASPAHADALAPTQVPSGLWLSDDGMAATQFSACGNALCGRIVWLKMARDKHGDTPHDANNPNPTLRARPICGLTLITGLKPAGPGTWTDGTVYAVRTGKTASLDMRQTQPDRLDLHGFVGTRFFGKDFTFTQAPPGLAVCKAK